MRSAPEIPDQLLDNIYDAATLPELWPQVLAGVADLTHSIGAIVHGVSFTDRFINFRHNGRLDEDCNAAFEARNIDNPWSGVMRLQPTGTIKRSDEIVRLPELRKTDFFHEVLRPQGAAHGVLGVLFQQQGLTGSFCLCRSEQNGGHSDADMALLKRLLPHLQRAMLLARQVESYRELQHANSAVLDRLAVGVFLLDAQGLLLFANEAGTRLTREDGPLTLRGGRVALRQRELADAIARAIDVVRAGEPAVTFRVPHGRNASQVVLQPVRSLDRERLRGLAPRTPAVILFVSEAAGAIRLPPDLLRSTYALTPAEIRVALGAAGGARPLEIADSLRLTGNTVKTHLRRIYAKTGVRRHAELVSLLLRMSSQFRD